MNHPRFESIRRGVRRLRYRFLKRVHRRGKRHWGDLNQTTVARGVAVGLFCGVLVPVAHIVFAVFVALAVRANPLVAALTTFVSNPFTLPFIYVYAFRIGSFLTNSRSTVAADLAATQAAAEQALVVANWSSTLLEWASTIAYPFLVGLMLVALTVALIGYLLVHACWGAQGFIQKYRNPPSC
jgi:uncharacterized protein (DUF2062 family)